MPALAATAWITIVDDHEITNDAWADGAQNRQPGEGDDAARKASALQAYLDERGLHAGHDPLHLALVDVADHTPAPAALDVQFLQHPVFDHRHPRFARGDVDQDLLAHAGCPKPRNRAAVSNRGSPITPE